jgi:hypothetical protein
MKNILKNNASFCTVVLGAIAAAAASGCANDVDQKTAAPAETASEQAAITAKSLVVSGCKASGVFDVVSPTFIQFIALDRSDLKDAQMQLSQVDESGRVTSTDQVATEADSAFQSMLDAEASSQEAARSSSEQSAQNASKAKAKTNSSADENSTLTSSKTVASTATVDTSSTHFDQHDATHEAAAESKAKNSQSASSTADAAQASKFNNFQAAFFSTIDSKDIDGKKFKNPFLAIFEQNSVLKANAENSANSRQAASTNAQSSSDQATSSRSADHVSNKTADTFHQATSNTTSEQQTIVSAKSSRLSASTLNAFFNEASQNAALESSNQASATNKLSKDESSRQKSSSLVFHDLEFMNSRHLLVRVEITSSKSQSILQLFQGTDGKLTSKQSFPISFPTCTDGGGTIQPVLTQPTVVTPVIDPPAGASAHVANTTLPAVLDERRR